MPRGRPKKIKTLDVPATPLIAEPEQPTYIPFGKPNGSIVKEFETEFAAFLGASNAVGVSSSTMGLMLSMAVSNIGDGREILTSPLVYPSVINAIMAMRVKPVFVDVDGHGNFDANKAKPLLMKSAHQIGGILLTHFGGAAADMREIMHLGKMHDLHVIEDAAFAFGAEFVGPGEGNRPGGRQKIGTIGDFTVFSFNPISNISAGEGGMVTTKHAELAERIRMLSKQGLSSSSWTGPIGSYEVLFPGYKGNMSELYAGMGREQFKKWPDNLANRTKVWNIYEDAFGWREPGHSKNLFMISVKDRIAFRQRMHEAGIGTGVCYSPVHLEPGYRFLRYKLGDFPNAERIGLSMVSLPLNPEMSEDDARRVVKEAKKWTGEAKNV